MKRRSFLYSLVLLTSCAVGKNLADEDAISETNSEPQEPEKLRFTVTDIQGLELLQSEYETFRATFAQVLQKTVEFVPVESYTAAAIAFQRGQVDVGLSGPSEYVIIHARTKATPLIGITRPKYYSVICTSANTGIRSLIGLKDRAIAMKSIGSTSGHLGPTHLLTQAGLDPKTDFNVVMLGSEGLQALRNGEVDAWGGGVEDYENFLKDANLSEDTMPLLASGPPLPNDVFVVSSQLNSGFVATLGDRMVRNQDVLLQSLVAVDNGKYREAELVPQNDADYDMVREAYQAIGQDDFI